jgi:hypothetical protein
LSTGDVPLDDAFVIGTVGPAIWSVPVVAGWEMTDSGRPGGTLLVNQETTCNFMTSQMLRVPTDPTATGDRAETEAGVTELQDSFLSQAPNAVLTDGAGIAVPYGDPASSSNDSVEFASFRGDYVRDDNGEKWSVLYAVRAMPQIEGLMYSALSCPTATINADESIWTALLDRTVVIAGE